MGDAANNYHTTNYEIDFIRKQGTGVWRDGCSMSREKLLKNYIEAAKTRVWDPSVDRNEVLSFAHQQLEMEKARNWSYKNVCKIDTGKLGSIDVWVR